jgi:death-on-curing protein
MTEYVTTADALFFHKHLIVRYGGATGIRDAGALESALHRPQTGYYDTIIHEAVALLESLVQPHPFVDGNKRVAFAVLDVFLRINGYSITADSKAIYRPRWPLQIPHPWPPQIPPLDWDVTMCVSCIQNDGNRMDWSVTRIPQR